MAHGDRAVGRGTVAVSRQTWLRRAAGRVLEAASGGRVTVPLQRSGARQQGTADSSRRPAPRVKGVRPRRSKDLGACVRLLRVVSTEDHYPVHWPDRPRAWLDGDEVLGAWVLERQGELLGHVAISRVGGDAASTLRWRELTGRRPSELAAVSRLFVRSRVRREGVATALLDVAVADIERRGLIPVAEVVTASDEAIELFDARGWRRRGIYAWGAKSDHLQVHCYVLPAERRGDRLAPTA